MCVRLSEILTIFFFICIICKRMSHMQYKNGLRTPLWGTPLYTFLNDSSVSLVRIYVVVSDVKNLIRLPKLGENLMDASFSSKISIFTLSKDPVTSRKAA